MLGPSVILTGVPLALGAAFGAVRAERYRSVAWIALVLALVETALLVYGACRASG